MSSDYEELYRYYNYTHTREFTSDGITQHCSKSVRLRMPLSPDDMDYEIQKYINLINKD